MAPIFPMSAILLKLVAPAVLQAVYPNALPLGPENAEEPLPYLTSPVAVIDKCEGWNTSTPVSTHEVDLESIAAVTLKGKVAGLVPPHRPEETAVWHSLKL